MAKATLMLTVGSRTEEFPIETVDEIVVRDEDDLADLLDREIEGVLYARDKSKSLKDAIYEWFLNHYQVVGAVYDEVEPDDNYGEPDSNEAGELLTCKTIMSGEEGYIEPADITTPCCGMRSPKGWSFHFECTREPNHDGLHAAHGSRGLQYATWERMEDVG